MLDRFIQIFWSHPRTRVRNLIKLQTFVDRNFKCFNQVALSNMQYFKTNSNHNCHSSSYAMILLRANAVNVFSDFQTIMNKHLNIALTFGTCSTFTQSSIQYYAFSAFHVRRYTENFFWSTDNLYLNFENWFNLLCADLLNLPSDVEIIMTRVFQDFVDYIRAPARKKRNFQKSLIRLINMFLLPCAQ